MYLVLSAIVHRHIYRYSLLKLFICSIAFCGCTVNCCSVASIYYRHTSGIEFCSVFYTVIYYLFMYICLLVLIACTFRIALYLVTGGL